MIRLGQRNITCLCLTQENTSSQTTNTQAAGTPTALPVGIRFEVFAVAVMPSHDPSVEDHLFTENIGYELHLLIFTKVPLPGCTKRRLSAQIGPELASRISAALIEHTLQTARDWKEQLQANVRSKFVHLFYSPVRNDSEQATDARHWLNVAVRDKYPAFRVLPQSEPERDVRNLENHDRLGLRLIQAFEYVAASIPQSCTALLVVIGSDCPSLDAALLERAFRRLDTGSQAVIGPAADGGYYLLGLRFDDKSRSNWVMITQAAFGPHLVFSQSDVCQRTVNALEAVGVAVTPLPETLWDIDTAKDLVHLPESLWTAGYSPAKARMQEDEEHALDKRHERV
jgi:glycosyltransferase A (GT-A) superfamily protein (DUF2064 family)